MGRGDFRTFERLQALRARAIKPSIFKNELLARLGPWHFILFEGLWCLADRKGRLEDRPDRIEAEIFPFKFQNVDVNKCLDDLQCKPQKGNIPFILRYRSKQNRYIQIINFEKHQYPHHREAESLILAPGQPRAKPGKSLNQPACITDSCSTDSPLLTAVKDVRERDNARAHEAERNGGSYLIPDPKDFPAAALAMTYKTLFKKIEHDDQIWDSEFGAAALKDAERIISACGSFHAANKCLQHYGALWERKGFDAWTLAGVAKQAPAWAAKQKGKEHGRLVGSRFFGALDTQRKTAQRMENPGNGKAIESKRLPTAMESETALRDQRRGAEPKRSGENETAS